MGWSPNLNQQTIDFHTNVARDVFNQKFISIQKYGRREIATANTEDIWEGAAATYAFQTSAIVLSVSSSDANDAAAGTGAQTLFIEGLDANFNLISETITLNGTSTVNTTALFIRVYRAFVLTAGASEGNEGVITIDAGSTEQATIVIGENTTKMTMFTVPAGHIGLIYYLFASLHQGTAAAGTKTAVASIKIRNFGGVFRAISEVGMSTNSNFIDKKFQTPIVIASKTDIKMIGLPDQNATEFHSGYSIVLEKTS